MRRKDYVLIAASCRRIVDRAIEGRAAPDVRMGIILTIRQIGADLHADNPAFDIERFKDDAGVGLRTPIREGLAT